MATSSIVGHFLLGSVLAAALILSIPEPGLSKVVGLASARTVARRKVSAVVATHHRTGTVLIQSILQKLSSQYFVDFERVFEGVNLMDLNSSQSSHNELYYDATMRMSAGMHGFLESCNSKKSSCDSFDFYCWMASCSLLMPSEEEIVPVVHVVRDPKSVLLSSYLYHQQDPPAEPWLKNPKPDAMNTLPVLQKKYANTPYYKVLQEVEPREGLTMEYFVNLSELFKSARNFRDLESKDWAINLRYEHSQSNFNQTFWGMLEHMQIFKPYDKEEIMEWICMFDIANMKEHISKMYGTMSHVTSTNHTREDLLLELENLPHIGEVLTLLSNSMGYGA